MAKPAYDEQVFINCPFDGEYRPMFEALVFAVHDCGFVARCALELQDASQVRIDKIERLIGACRLGIHDISRTELDSAWGLPRFNMPLELGIFWGRSGSGRRSSERSLGWFWTVSHFATRSTAQTSQARTYIPTTAIRCRPSGSFVIGFGTHP